MNKFIRAIEILLVAIITDYIFLLSGFTYGLFESMFIFYLLLILLPFLCSFLFYMVIQSPSPKEKVAFNILKLILLFALAKFVNTRYLGGEEGIFYVYLLSILFLDAVFSVLVFYLIGWWMKRKQFGVILGIRGKRVVTVLLTSFMIITIPILFKNYWHYFDGSWSGTYVSSYSNDKVVLDQHYFCYNDVVEADFKIRDSSVVLDLDSIRVKENPSDIYTDSQKQKMLDKIISLAENDNIHMGGEQHEMYFDYGIRPTNYTKLDRVRDSVSASGYFDDSPRPGTYASTDSNDRVVLDQHYFCYNDVVEANFKFGDGAIVLDIDSIRIKDSASDIYTDSQKQKMLDKIISLAENNSIHLAGALYLYHNDWDYIVLHRVADSVAAFFGYSDGSWSGTYASTNNKVVLDQNYFCYKDVVEADFEFVDGAIVLNLDSIRIKENSSDIYTDSQKQEMLDEIISIAENNGIHLSARNGKDCLYLYHDDGIYYALDRVAE